MKVCKSEAVRGHGHVYSRLNFLRCLHAVTSSFLLLKELHRLANDDVYLAETKVATFGGIGAWFTPLLSIYQSLSKAKLFICSSIPNTMLA